MKRLLVVLLLVLAVSTGYSQEQFRRIYSQVVLTDKDSKVTKKIAQNTVIFNYGNKPIVKLLLNDGTTRMLTQTSDREYGTTDGGVSYESAMYEEKTEHFYALLQLFDEEQYGVRLIFDGGQTIQFIP